MLQLSLRALRRPLIQPVYAAQKRFRQNHTPQPTSKHRGHVTPPAPPMLQPLRATKLSRKLDLGLIEPMFGPPPEKPRKNHFLHLQGSALLRALMTEKQAQDAKLAEQKKSGDSASEVKQPGDKTPDHKKDNKELKVLEKEVFIFPSGALISWSTTPEEDKTLVKRLLDAGDAVKDPVDILEQDDFTWNYQRMLEMTDVDMDHFSLADEAHKVPVSFALASSINLNWLEHETHRRFEMVEDLLKQSARRAIPDALVSSNRLAVLKIWKQARPSSADEYFWLHPENMQLFNKVNKYLEIQTRSKTLNETIDYVQSLISALSDDLKHKHSSFLESVIILLICIEVMFALLDHWQIWRGSDTTENRHHLDPNYIPPPVSQK